MEMPSIPQPTYMFSKCEQSSPPGMPKPSCKMKIQEIYLISTAQSLMQKSVMGPVQIVKNIMSRKMPNGDL